MEPKELREYVRTIHIWHALVQHYAQHIQVPIRDARHELMENLLGDMEVIEGDNSYVFTDLYEGLTFVWDEKQEEWVTVEYE